MYYILGQIDTRGELPFFIFCAVASLFCLVFVFSVAFAVRVHLRSKHWNVTKVVLFLLPVCLLARCLDLLRNYMVSREELIGRPVTQQTPLDMLSGGLPVYLFFTTYIQVCLLWFYLHKIHKKDHRLSMSPLKNFKLVSLVLNLLVYMCWAGFMVAFFLTGLPIIHEAETLFSTAVSVAAGLASFYFGKQLHSQMTNSLAADRRLMMIRKISYTTLICTFVFLIRAILIVFSFYYCRGAQQFDIILLNIIWWIIIEIAPTMMIILVMHSNSKNTDAPASAAGHVNRKSAPAGASTPLLSEYSIPE